MPFDQPKYSPTLIRSSEVQLVTYDQKRRTVPHNFVPPPVPPCDTFADNWKPKLWREIRLSNFEYLPIERMKLPNPGWWQYFRNSTYPPTGYKLELSLIGDKGTTLTFFSDGREATEESGLRAILKQPAHKLTDAEITALNYGNKNICSEAHSEKLNGKLVVFEAGHKDDEGQLVCRVEFNHNPDGTEPLVPAEIRFRAKPDKYKKYIKAVLDSIRTIKWDAKAHLTP